MDKFGPTDPAESVPERKRQGMARHLPNSTYLHLHYSPTGRKLLSPVLKLLCLLITYTILVSSKLCRHTFFVLL